MSIIEGYSPGCIGRVAELHASDYSASNRFGAEFEAKVASEFSQFCLAYESDRDGMWFAKHERIEGSIVLDGSHAHETGAHLRWFIASDALRGGGVGKELLRRALEFSDACGYKRVYLWTFAGLHAARHLYESFGFKLVHESPGTSWGTLVTEQRFEREA